MTSYSINLLLVNALKFVESSLKLFFVAMLGNPQQAFRSSRTTFV